MNLSPALDASVVGYLRDIPWLLIAPALVFASVRFGHKLLAWGAPLAALWAAWRCITPALGLPLTLGGVAGWSMAPLSAAAMLVLFGASVRAAREAPEVGARTRHAVFLAAFVVAVIALAAVAATFRLVSVKGAG